LTCQHCGGSARYVSLRTKIFTSLYGPIEVQRAYYHCAHCRHGSCPLEAELAVEDGRTPAARETIAVAGLEDSFIAAAELLYRLAGLKVSAATVRRVTEAAGRQLARRQAEGPVCSEGDWDWHIDSQGVACGFLALDSTGVRQQEPGGKRREARMAHVGRLSNAPPDREEPSAPRRTKKAAKSRFLAGHSTLDEIAQRLRKWADVCGGERVQQWVATGDAANGLEPALRREFPFLEYIVDFFHAREYLVELAQELFSDDCERQTWTAAQCHALKHRGGDAIVAILEQLDARPLGSSARAAYDAALRYFRNHADHMHYPEYLARGWPIGSGAVEAGCKHVVKARMDGSGMRWRESGSDSVCRLRALFLSGANAWRALWRSAA
jgi:hypothetical protein